MELFCGVDTLWSEVITWPEYADAQRFDRQQDEKGLKMNNFIEKDFKTVRFFSLNYVSTCFSQTSKWGKVTVKNCQMTEIVGEPQESRLVT